MEKRTLMAFVLSFLVLVLWSYFFSPQPEPPPERQAAPPAPVQQPYSPEDVRPYVERQVDEAVLQSAEREPVRPAVKFVEVDTPRYSMIMSTEGPTITSFKLKHYRETADRGSPVIELVSLSPGQALPLEIAYTPAGSGIIPPAVYEVEETRIVLGEGDSPRDLVFRSEPREGVESVYTFRFFPDRYSVDLDIQSRNLGQAPVQGTFTAQLRALPHDTGQGYYAFRGLAVLADGKVNELKMKKSHEEERIEGAIGWVAYEDEYFMTAIVPEDHSRALFTGIKLLSGVLEGVHSPEPVQIQPSGAASARYSLYYGPRDLGILKAEGNSLEKAIYFGWTDIIAKPLLHVLRFFEKYLHNYGLAIIFLTILVKILFWPLTNKSYRSMGEMKKLQPRLLKLREKYKNDRQAMNREMMTLYRTYKINPMSGCLPMVVQLPVFFALFRVLGSAIELRHAPFFLWINDLSAPDRLFSLPVSLPLMAPPIGIPVLTLLMGASMFLQQKMTPTPGDPAQARIMMLLPVIFTFFFINFPSGLVLYWLVNNLISIGQQYHVLKRSK